MRFMHQTIKRFLMMYDTSIDPPVSATLSAIRRWAGRISGRPYAARTDFMTDHQRRDIGLLDGRSTPRNAEHTASRRI